VVSTLSVMEAADESEAAQESSITWDQEGRTSYQNCLVHRAGPKGTHVYCGTCEALNLRTWHLSVEVHDQVEHHQNNLQ